MRLLFENNELPNGSIIVCSTPKTETSPKSAMDATVPWQTRREAELAILQYINGFCNPRRRHSALGWKSPVAFERKVA
ncbi:IS3 family transposase [Yoonia sp. R2331]|uniref:IS3 family transposase n=1 Tax=Yoonia sp. R2331 TaxID=3237238 RepID=UPI0034E48B51